MSLAKECDVPNCKARTLRAYCIRCEINGQAREHADRPSEAAEEKQAA